MLNAFLKVSYETQKRATFVGEIEELLKQLPDEDLSKLASGVSIKEAWGAECAPDGTPTSFLDKFKGTPLMEQAIALEQEEIQADMLDMQRREESRSRMQEENNVWDLKDKIRLKRRLLELQLAKEQSGMAQPPASPPGMSAQGAGALGDVPAEGVQDNSQGIVGSKTAATSLEKEKFAFADGVGREMARGDAQQFELQKIASAAGAMMAKEGLNLGAITGALGKLGPMAGKAIGFAAKNPALTGAAVGAAGGALAGGEGHRLSGALGGAALGGAAGSAAGGIAKNIGAGQGVMEAAKNYGGGVLNKAKSLVGAGGGSPSGRAAMPSMNPSMTTPSLAPPNPMDFAKRNMFGQPKMAMTEALVRGIPTE
jgi:hypothetical protein